MKFEFLLNILCNFQNDLLLIFIKYLEPLMEKYISSLPKRTGCLLTNRNALSMNICQGAFDRVELVMGPVSTDK